MSYYGNDPNSSSGGGFYGSSNAGYSAANVQAWQAKTQQQQHDSQQQQQQSLQQGYSQQQQNHQQQHQHHAGIWNPATAAAMANVAGSMMSGGGLHNDAVLKAGQTFFQQGTARMIPGLESIVLLLRNYFAVDNRYVLRKMQKVLFPFLSKQWQRQIKQHASPDMATQYELPTMDQNAPDLYLPLMTLITYVLLSAVLYGTAGQFNPEVIPDVTTKCFITQILEVLAIRFGFYLMQAPVALLDLFSYTGYKYLGLCLNLLIGLLVSHFGLGKKGYYLCFCWTASAAAFFMLKTMANNIPLQTATGGPKRDVMVFVFAGSQLVTMWFVSQTKFL